MSIFWTSPAPRELEAAPLAPRRDDGAYVSIVLAVLIVVCAIWP